MIWPNERQWFTIGLFWLTVFMLLMALYDPKLWTIDIFKSLIQVVVVTGLINMAGAFNFSASKADDAKTANTAKAFDAITATANAGNGATGKPGDPVNVEVK